MSGFRSSGGRLASFPIRLVTVSTVLMAGALGWFGWERYRSDSVAVERRRAEALHAELRMKILHLDEVLTMSARLAAATGDPRWEKRYRAFEPKLDAVLQRALAFASQAGAEGSIEKVRKANDELVRMEQEAFDAVRGGNLSRAQEILNSRHYHLEKNAYFRGVEGFAIEANSAGRVRELPERILYLDEVLTMSARMAAATGDSAWETRYHEHEPILDETLGEASALGGDFGADMAAGGTKEANDALVRLEAEAFEWIRRGSPERAQSILSGAEYHTLKERYSAGMDAFSEALRTASAAEESQQARKGVFRSGVLVGLLILLIGSWILLVRGVGRWRNALTGAYQESQESRARLGEAHAELENRVLERTAELRDANERLSEEIAERRHAEASRQALEIQLREAQKLEAMGHLASGIAHEINTPIQYVGDNLKFLEEAFASYRKALDAYARHRGNGVEEDSVRRLDEALDEADVAYLEGEVPRALAQSHEGVGRVSKIVRAMKEFTHPGGEGATLTDLNRAVETTLLVARNEWRYVAETETDLDPALPQVRCRAGEINQVLLNLVINAAHAIADGRQGDANEKGRITVRSRRVGDGVEIRVQDTGVGIPKAARSRIFEPFFTTKAVGRGTGQGLAMAHAVVVKRHGGVLSFESEVGKGTTFIVRLPIQLDESGAA